jgi:uncharacterized YigZ family protein
MNYLIPVEIHRTEIIVVNSRFIATAGYVHTVEEAKQFLATVRSEMPDASHHVYAFRVGYGNSVIEGMSDDGEPSGTAGPPALSVLRGTEIGDVIVVITRYFGGTKLGTGGLVRAYTEAAQTVLSTLKTALNIKKQIVGIEFSYPLYERIKRLIGQFDGVIEDETFAVDITLLVNFPVDQISGFAADLKELTAGQVSPILFE